MLELLRAGWCEPPDQDALHLSTLIQQLLSAIAQHGGITAAAGYRALCGPGSPFTAVTQAQFGSLLRDLGAKEVLIQAADGTLLLGPLGERTVNHYSFYAAFTAAEEYRLFTGRPPAGHYASRPHPLRRCAADLRRPPVEGDRRRPCAQDHRSGAGARRQTATFQWRYRRRA